MSFKIIFDIRSYHYIPVRLTGLDSRRVRHTASVSAHTSCCHDNQTLSRDTCRSTRPHLSHSPGRRHSATGWGYTSCHDT